MQFATQEFAANGQAALALVAALMEWLEKDATFTPKDRRDVIVRAQELAPRGAGRTDREAQAILASMLA